MLIPNESQIFLTGLIAMLIFSFWFLINRKRSEYFSMAFLVSSITSLTYALLLDGTIVGFTQSGHPIYFTRWIFYIASCALLMLTITKILKVKKENVLPVLVLNSLVMLSGALAAVTASPSKWIIFGLGSIFFGMQLYLLFEKSKPNKLKKMVLYYISFGWAVFPIIFVFSPEGLDIISNYITATLYLILDMFTKITFYLHLAHSSKSKR